MNKLIMGLFLGAIQGSHHHHHPHHRHSMGQEVSSQEDCTGLCLTYKQKYENLLAQQHKFTDELHGLEKKFFATGYADGESMDEQIKINGEGRQLPIKYHQKEFAEGYGDREEFGETIQSKGPSGMVKHSYVQNASAPATPEQVVPGFIKTAAESKNQAGKAGADGKYHIKDAQTQVDYLDERTEVA